MVVVEVVEAIVLTSNGLMCPILSTNIPKQGSNDFIMVNSYISYKIIDQC